jgi:hypothetical protein
VGTGGIYQRTHPHLSQPTYTAGEQYHLSNQAPEYRIQAREYSLLHAAMILHSSGRFGRRYADAWKAASWGRFQVLGLHYASLGWGSIEEFVASMYESEWEHLVAFREFVKMKNLVGHLRNCDWYDFALVYNGKKQPAKYAGWLANAYRRQGGRQPAGVP